MNASVHGVSLHTCWTNGLHAVLAWSVTVARATGCLTCFVNNVAGWLPVIVWSCCVSTAKFPIDKMLLNPCMHKILWACVLYSLLSYRAPMCTLSLCWIGVGLSSSFLWASEGDVRHFFGGWFLDRLGLNPAGVWLFRLRAERRPELPPKLPLQLHPQLHPLHGFCMVFSCFRSCLSGDVRHWRWLFFIFLVGVRRRR